MKYSTVYRVSVLGLRDRGPSNKPSPFSFLVVCFGSRLDLRHYSRCTSTLFANQNIYDCTQTSALRAVVARVCQ